MLATCAIDILLVFVESISLPNTEIYRTVYMYIPFGITVKAYRIFFGNSSVRGYPGSTVREIAQCLAYIIKE